MYASTAEKIVLDTMKLLVCLGFGSEELKNRQLRSYAHFFIVTSLALKNSSVHDRT